jgi:hypothetical protein
MVTNRVNTMVVSSRLDSRELAMMVLAWELEIGSRPRSMSWLIREIVGAMAEMMHKKHGQAVEVDSHQAAFDIIEGRDLRAHSIGSLHALTRGLQAEGLEPSVPDESEYFSSNKILTDAIAVGKRLGQSDEEITERVGAMAAKQERERIQKEQEDRDAREQRNREQLSGWRAQDQARRQAPELTPEQKTANFEASVVKELGNEWEGPIHKIVIENTRKLWMIRTPEGTEAEFDAWLLRMVEMAKPDIDTRQERFRESLEEQEREKALRKQAKEAVAG